MTSRCDVTLLRQAQVTSRCDGAVCDVITFVVTIGDNVISVTSQCCCDAIGMRTESTITASSHDVGLPQVAMHSNDINSTAANCRIALKFDTLVYLRIRISCGTALVMQNLGFWKLIGGG